MIVGAGSSSALVKMWRHVGGNRGTAEVAWKGSLGRVQGKINGPDAGSLQYPMALRRAGQAAQLSIPVEAQEVGEREKETRGV